eukprot:TRINITY_DN62706_c0_g1_i1.p1 TRINITY_DN62706_c0_g1~~TRINITY_DN62706_c0_g1_i1.p1  ORF type:complete len:328 (+),score=91.45 TRINITY_DN62706_c0_g1_i1:100-984(+)
MGTGASAGVAAAIETTEEEDLQKLMKGLSAKSVEKLSRVLQSQSAPSKNDDAKEGSKATDDEAVNVKTGAALLNVQDNASTVASTATEAGKKEEAPAASSRKEVDEKHIAKIHSTIRWGKPREEVTSVLESLGVAVEDALAASDPKNGNYALHIAAQNGHMDLVKFAIENKADVNVQNNKGQTPLHMSVEYDFYFQTKLLMDAGADPKRKNGEGHEALTGIDGGKTGNDAWDSPVTVLKATADDQEQLDFAFGLLEKADPSTIDKASLVQAGMQKKKTYKKWDSTRFMGIVKGL